MTVYEPDFVTFAEKKTHRCFLVRDPLIAGLLYGHGYPATAPAEGSTWTSDDNWIFWQTGKHEIWIVGPRDWCVKVRESSFDVGGVIKTVLVPVEDYDRPISELVKFAWNHPNGIKKRSQPPPPPEPTRNNPSGFSVNGAVKVQAKPNRYGAVDIGNNIIEVHCERK